MPAWRGDLNTPNAQGDKVTMNVGFYYMANAFGRLAGTILSGTPGAGASSRSPSVV